MDTKPALIPPRAERRAHITSHHGIVRNDVYAWLRAENWQQVMREPQALPQDIRDYLEAENAHSDAVMADTEALQETIFAELKGRIKEDDSSVPMSDRDYAYYVGYVQGGQHARYCRRARDLTGDEAVLVDGNAEADGRGFFKLGSMIHSPDHKLVAWSHDDQGSELYQLRIRDLGSGKDLSDWIDNSTGHIAWAADSKSFFYVENDENHRPCRVWHHVIGTARIEDKLVYQEPDPGFFVGVSKTQSDEFVVISSHDHETSELRVVPARDPLAPLTLIAPRQVGVEYDIDHWQDRFIVLANHDGAEDFKIATAPIAAPGPENWRDLVPHVKGRLILNIEAYKNYLVRLEREDGLPRIVIRDMATGEEHAIAFDEEAYSLGMSGSLEYDTEFTRFSYSSMTTPVQVHDYNMRTRERVLRKNQEIPSGHDPSLYVTRRVFAPAEDGERVPVSLLYRKETPLDGTAPGWLYGYGSYGITISASFNSHWLSLADRGFICAVAHVRGGKDKGYRWYLEGKREKKTNSFTDFIAAARYLSAHQFVSPHRIVAHGGSAGGMLMGAISNMAPELFKGIIAEVPFVDVLTTMLDDTLPLTPPEWQEWGNPIESKEAYELLLSYSPYDNVEMKGYPHILAVAGLTDPRVTYWEPAKWVARLREMKTDGNLLLLRTQMGAGHAGAPGRFDRLKEIAFVYAFGLKITGLT
ncbi:MAG TPA: S9 family peptidase [Aestuariivirgaceae bacterium]